MLYSGFPATTLVKLETRVGHLSQTIYLKTCGTFNCRSQAQFEQKARSSFNRRLELEVEVAANDWFHTPLVAKPSRGRFTYT